jgi:hypothetical protein
MSKGEMGSRRREVRDRGEMGILNKKVISRDEKRRGRRAEGRRTGVWRRRTQALKGSLGMVQRAIVDKVW